MHLGVSGSLTLFAELRHFGDTGPFLQAMGLYRFFVSSRRRHTSCSGDWSSDVCSPDLGRSSNRYIFDGGPGGAPAERAFLRATFRNPVLPGRGERRFAVDERLRDADRVTVVCLVTADGRRYLVMPGLQRWGFEQPLAEDLEAFLAANPEEGWLGPRAYDELLDRTGITRALREVLALPQGAIDRTMDEPPAGLLAKLLELTGERALLDEVEAQRERAADARAAYLEAVEAARAEQDRLGSLGGLAARHREWAGLSERLAVLNDLARPAAEHRDVLVKVEAARADRDAAAERIAADRRDLDELAGGLPALEARAASLAGQAGELADRLAATREQRAALELRLAAAEARAEEAQQTAARLAGLAGERTAEQAAAEVHAAESSLAAVLARREELRAALAGVQARTATLAAGGVPVPAEVTAFKETLADAGIEASATPSGPCWCRRTATGRRPPWPSSTATAGGSPAAGPATPGPP